MKIPTGRTRPWIRLRIGATLLAVSVGEVKVGGRGREGGKVRNHTHADRATRFLLPRASYVLQ